MDTPQSQGPEQRLVGINLTKTIVGATIGAVLVVVIYALCGPYWGTGLNVYLAYEAWTLSNRHKNDEISAAMWLLSAWPLIPFLFGLACGYGLESGLINGNYLGFAVGFLMAHFFWQRRGGQSDEGPDARPRVD